MCRQFVNAALSLQLLRTLFRSRSRVLYLLLRVSQTVLQRNPEASAIEEGVISGEQMLMSNQQSTELAEPSIGVFGKFSWVLPHIW